MTFKTANCALFKLFVAFTGIIVLLNVAQGSLQDCLSAAALEFEADHNQNRADRRGGPGGGVEDLGI